MLSGEIKKAVTLKGIGATKGARAAIEAAGGKIEELKRLRTSNRRSVATSITAIRQRHSATRPASARFATRLLFLIGALIVYRIGTFIPVPGIDPSAVARFFTDQSNTIFGIVNMFSGGALSRLSIFAMGVMPYISASIIIQMMAMVVPSLMELRKEGESGRRKITRVHALRHGGAGGVPVVRRGRSRCRRAAWC